MEYTKRKAFTKNEELLKFLVLFYKHYPCEHKGCFDVSLFELFYRGDGEGFAVYGEFDFVACEGEAVGALGVINVGRARVLGKDLAKDFSLIFGQWGKGIVACLNA